MTDVFKRTELKYLLTQEQYDAIQARIKDYFVPDEYFKSDICSIYCDTPDFLLARRSIEKPDYKEKLRIRSYGVVKENAPVFVEIKKKCNAIVYKRRIKANENNAFEIVAGRAKDNSQIGNEIFYFQQLYHGLQPVMFVSYTREAFTCKDDASLRLTFDHNALWRDYDLTLHHGIYGEPVFPAGKIMMEIKTASALPLWLVEILSQNAVYKTSFSKYGTAYTKYIMKAKQGGKKIA